MSREAKPVGELERIQILDILRGFAILGILLVNIGGFATPMFLPGYTEPAMPSHDVLAGDLMVLLAEGKFYSIFSFLFGLGFAVQLARADVKGLEVATFYPRRLKALLGLGVVHATLLWMGDILRLYAVLGLALFAFRRTPNRTLWRWVMGALGVGLMAVGLLGGPGSNGGTFFGIDFVGYARAAYTAPSYLPVLVFQAVMMVPSWLLIAGMQGANVLAMFLLGMMAGRAGLFERSSDWRGFWRRLCLVGLTLGLLLNVPMVLFKEEIFSSLSFVLGAPLLAAGYVSCFVLVSMNKTGLRIIAPLRHVGRMALTNYVTQSVVCSIIFGGWGLGYYEEVGTAGLMGMAFTVYALQIPLSWLWLRRFHYGPLEWLWRWMTYGVKSEFLRSRPAALGSESVVAVGPRPGASH